MIRGSIGYPIRAWDRLGLRIFPQAGIRGIATAVLIGLAFGTYMGSADVFVFRAVVPASQRAVVATTSAIQRIAFFAPLALLDEIAFRLLLMSALVWLLTCTKAPFGPVCPSGDFRVWTAIIAVAVIYMPLHPAYLASLDLLAPLVVAREVALHISAGILWGYLYWRYGLVSAIAGHIGAHVALQPLLGYFLV